jgi:hypothetical protein
MKATYTGRIEGDAAALAIAVKEGKAVAYLCDGKKIESWSKGTEVDGEILLTGNSSKLTGTLTNSVARGVVAVAGKQWNFRIKLSKPPSGLYRMATQVNRAMVVGGWIVDGTQTIGIVNVAGTPMPAPPIDTTSPAVARRSNHLRRSAGGGEIRLG